MYQAEEFCDIFIKILNGFDFVLTSLTTMSNEKPIKTILLEIVPALQIANSIFNGDSYKEDSEKSHPKTKLLLSATLKLQQELRKGLFNYIFEDQESAQVVLEFFEYKW